MKINLEIEEDFLRRPNCLRWQSKRTTPATSSLSPVRPAYLPWPQLPCTSLPFSRCAWPL